MATDQVMHWINRDIRLSQVINSFETDFANGYLFGEILCQFGVYEDVSIFSKKTNKEAKVNNFYLIEDALRALKVRFDGKMTHNIMQEERGAALRLLYQLKLAIQKREGPAADALEEQTMTGLKASTVNRRLVATMEKSNNMAGTIQPRTVNGKDIRTQKQKLHDAQLIRFQVSKKVLFDNALAQEDQEKTLIKTIQQQKRSENRSKLRENQDFMKEWEEEGRQNWKTNQRTRADNIARQKYFEDREVNLYKEKLNRELNQATAEIHVGFNEFEKNLQKLGIEQNINMDDAIQRQEEKKGIPPGQIQNFSFPATMNKIKETKKQSDFAGKERERRRRKLAVDQSHTQQRLDKQKQEDMLIQKLLAQQKDEQNQAYTDERLRKCKNMQTNQRRVKALQVQAKRDVIYKEMEAQSKIEAKTREAERKVQIEMQQKEYSNINRQTKRAKRSVNIEIVSGIVDLVMDLADEVYDVTQNQPGKKLTKAQWREFSGIFVDGKKCSLRNIKKAIVDTEETEQKNEEGALIIPPNSSAVKIINSFEREPALHDLYQFISNSGLFNLDQIKSDLILHWGEQLNIEKFLLPGNGRLVQNEALGEMLDKLYKVQSASLFTGADQKTEEIKEAADEGEEEDYPGRIPSELPIKLAILGRAFAGKKTIANQLMEKYGGSTNIKVFNMDEVIKEALDYITPKKIDEAAAEAQKKAKKGKQVEEENTDIFEGKHVNQYKKIITEIKSKFFADYEGDTLQQVDLPNLVFDDQLLVNLFVERLKLQYEGVDLSVSEENLESGITREKEIIGQLAELEESAPVTEAKKGGKAAAKGGNKNADETLKEELESIRTIEPKGWILLDFPRNLSQMKLLETSLSCYESKADQTKDVKQSKFEAWSKIATPPCMADEQEESNAQGAVQSGLDGVIILNTPNTECSRRSQNRKIDPQTQQVYHMETEAPEDNKVLDRLQEYTDEAGNSERMQKISTSFSQSIGAIKQWLTRFGLNSADGTCQVQLDMVIDLEPRIETLPQAEGDENPAETKTVDPWKEKGTVIEQVLQKVDKVREYRQMQFQLKRDQISEAMDTLAVQEENRLAKLEEERKAKEEAEQKQQQEEGSVAAIDKQLEGSDDKLSQLKKTQDGGFPSIELVGDEEEIPDAMKTISSSKKLLSEHLHSVGGTSKSIGRSTKFFQRIQEINDKQKITKWEDMLTEYYSESMREFNKMRNLRQRVCASLNDTQRKFINYLGRRSEQQRKINDYCENYNRFSREFPDLIGNKETQKELQNRINILSKMLWENIKARKDEAMQERLSYMEGGWVQIEMVKLCSSTAKLIENEFRRFSTISAVVTGHLINEEVDLVDAAKKLTERGVEPYIDNQEDRSQVGQSPLLLEVAQTILGKVEALFNEQFVLSLDQKILNVLQKERMNFSMRLNLLFTWATLILHEISSQAFQVFDVLDDWVVIAVKRENQACQSAVKEISEAVNNNEMHLETAILQSLDLGNHIETIEFYDGPPQYMVDARPVFTVEQSRFSLDSLTLIYRQMRDNQQDSNLIDSQTFQTMILLNMQKNLLPNVWRFVPFDTIINLASKLEAQPLTDSPNASANFKMYKNSAKSSGQGDSEETERKFLDWRKAFVILALMAGKIPTSEDKESYFSKLRAKLSVSEDNLLKKDAFVSVEAWFDKCESATLQHDPVLTLSPSQQSPKSMSAGSPLMYDNQTSERQLAQIDASFDEDDDEAGDMERLDTVKSLLFDTYRIQNRQGLLLEDYIKDLEFVFSASRSSDSDERTLYHTILNMAQ